MLGKALHTATLSTAVVTVFGLVAAVGPVAVADGTDGTDGTHSSVLVVGDSITRLSTPALRARALEWEVDARGGRKVTSLGWVLADHLDAGESPRTVVAALGANAQPGWDPAVGYRELLAPLPESTIVVLVSVYRDPAYFTPRIARKRPDWNPQYAAAYTRVMHQIAAERPHTCVAPWRPWAAAHRRNLTGGVHPHGYGRRAWARIVAGAVASCN